MIFFSLLLYYVMLSVLRPNLVFSTTIKLIYLVKHIVYILEGKYLDCGCNQTKCQRRYGFRVST